MRLRLVLLAVAAAGLTGCAFLSQLLKSAFQQPAFSFRNVALSDISLGGLTLDTVWDLSNPNSVGLSLASVDYALFIDEKQVVAGAPPQGLTIPARGSTELHFPASFKFTDIVAVIDTFLNKDNATWRAEGGLGLQTPIGVIRLPIAKSGDFEVPKVPLVAFDNPRITNVTLQGATIEFPLKVTNRNSYALPIAGVTGNLVMAGNNIGTLSTGNLGQMEGKGLKQVTLPLTINFLQAANAAVTAARGGNAQVSFTAQLQSGPQTVPVRVDQLLTFIR
jgi:LEA14-like dessication related protein